MRYRNAYAGALVSLLLVLSVGGCSMKFRPSSPADVRKCCERLSVRHKEMSQFNRYCKVALFLSKSTVASIGKGVKENAAVAVSLCKFVFNVETDEDLIAAGDEQEYYRVRSFVKVRRNSDFDESGWLKKLDCDPMEPTCEEF
jgi:hypothetical protein|tara:strand:+ start:2552 stop:2980 length:429 start_codon:yes stop_codon:yes gene_type:complete